MHRSARVALLPRLEAARVDEHESRLSGLKRGVRIAHIRLEGKARPAFRGGFLGVESFGWSTLVQIVAASEADREALVQALARRLMADFGAPDMDAARAAAAEEVAFAESLCNQPLDTLIAVHRSCDDGAVRESFRTLKPRDGAAPARAFSFMDVEGDDERPGEPVDLVGIARGERK